MTHPLTPREKVTRLIDNAPEHQTADELADAILAALASSGDHADHSGGVTDMVDHAELADLREHRITADLLVSTLKADKAEAERKLAEAVGLLREMFEDGPVEVAFAGNPIACAELSARCTDFLSKEAERG